MKVLCQPVSKITQRSKLVRTIETLGWERVDSGEHDVAMWGTDGVCREVHFHNHRVVALDKERLALCFAEAFGYGLGVNPAVYEGLAVEKILGHERHGRVVRCPRRAVAGMCYQKFLTNGRGALMEELRFAIVGREMLVTAKRLHKLKDGMPEAGRYPGSMTFDVPERDFITERESKQVWDLCSLLGFEHGDLDAIRHEDGRLYVIDATTNAGVPEGWWHTGGLTKEGYLKRNSELFERWFQV